MITIYTGVNGSGKSYLLNQYAKKSKLKNNTIVISTALIDRFSARKKINYSYMGPNIGLNSIERSLKIAFSNTKKDPNIFSNAIASILQYAEINGSIGFKLVGYYSDTSRFSGKTQKDLEEYLELEKLIESVRKDRIIELRNQDDPVIILGDVEDGDFLYNNRVYDFIPKLLKLESKLKKHKILKKIQLLIERRFSNKIPKHIASEFLSDIYIPITQLSSGELSLISTAIFIASFITDKTTLIIDEPENSLHPEWQQSYISNIKNLFPYYEMDIIIATHSPIIISSSLSEPDVDVLRYDGKEFVTVNNKIRNIEQAYIEQFGIITPENSSLSEKCINLINSVNSREKTLSDAIKTIEYYKYITKDKAQEQFLDGIEEILIIADKTKPE